MFGMFTGATPSDYDRDIFAVRAKLAAEGTSESEKAELQKELSALEDAQNKAVEARRTNEALDLRVRAMEADLARQQRRQLGSSFGWGTRNVKATKVAFNFDFDAETGAQKMSLNIESAPEKYVSDFVDYSAARTPEDYEVLRKQETEAAEKLPKYMVDDALAKLHQFVKACTGAEDFYGYGNGDTEGSSGGMFGTKVRR